MTPTQEFEMKKLAREKLASFFYDLAKVSFSVMVLGVFVPYITTHSLSGQSTVLIVLGIITTVVFSIIANSVLKTKE